jgi:hypothetical protein
VRLRILSVFASLALCATWAAEPTEAQTAAPKAAPRPAATGAPANDVDTVIQLVKSGMPDSLVIKTLQKSGKSYNLAPADVLRLRNNGVSNAVIEAMVDASPAPAPSAVSPAAPKAPAVAAANPASAPGDREPTEKEMLAVFQASFDASNSAFKAKEDQCKSGAYRNNNDPALAMMCLGGAIATGGRGGIRKSVTGFRKVACSRANGAAGWVCDYVIQMDVAGINATPSLKEMVTTPTIQHGRFVYTGGQWILVQQ